jgi:hypothetical protein
VHQNRRQRQQRDRGDCRNDKLASQTVDCRH